MKEKCKELLRELTGKKHITFVKSGNKAILIVLKRMKQLGLEKVFIQDQGGWLTYHQYPKRLKLKLIEIMTDYGIVNERIAADQDSILLINSMPGYHALQNMDIFEGTLINDVSGSIGTKEAKFGDFNVGSFGRWKPIDVGKGGFIASDEPIRDDEEIDYNLLYSKLKTLKHRLDYFKKINEKIKDDLKDFDIIHLDLDGINVIVRFSNDVEKDSIISYCERNKYEFTICPRYIRVNEKAISIEVKRVVE